MTGVRSIRWQLQLWHGAVLVFVLAALGVTAWDLGRSVMLRRVDQELERRIAAVVSEVGLGPVRAPRGRQDAGGVREPARSVRESSSFGVQAGGLYYYLVWSGGARDPVRSARAPEGVPRPPAGDGPGSARTRGSAREYVRQTPQGDCVLVGRDIRDELAAVRRNGWMLVGAGFGVLALGLAGGWWVTTRALRPIADISETARAIAAGDSGRRMHPEEMSSELGGLARVLDETFGKLREAMDRQVRFTGDASHELRTPIAVILAQTQSALARERGAGEYRAALEACERAALRLRGLAEGLLTMAGIDTAERAGVRQFCDLAEITGAAVGFLRPLAAERSTEIRIESSPAVCSGDPELLAGVVTNLVGNAITHNPPGGRVTVRVRGGPEGSVLEVMDTGCGIDAVHLPHLFERFYRVDASRARAGGHAGLGLSIVEGTVRAHGGTVEVESTPGVGSCFRVRLPGVAEEGR